MSLSGLILFKIQHKFLPQSNPHGKFPARHCKQLGPFLWSDAENSVASKGRTFSTWHFLKVYGAQNFPLQFIICSSLNSCFTCCRVSKVGSGHKCTVDSQKVGLQMCKCILTYRVSTEPGTCSKGKKSAASHAPDSHAPDSHAPDSHAFVSTFPAPTSQASSGRFFNRSKIKGTSRWPAWKGWKADCNEVAKVIFVSHVSWHFFHSIPVNWNPPSLNLCCWCSGKT